MDVLDSSLYHSLSSPLPGRIVDVSSAHLKYHNAIYVGYLQDKLKESE